MAVYFQCGQCGRDHGIPAAVREQAFRVFQRRFALHPEFHSLFCAFTGKHVQVGANDLVWKDGH